MQFGISFWGVTLHYMYKVLCSIVVLKNKNQQSKFEDLIDITECK